MLIGRPLLSAILLWLKARLSGCGYFVQPVQVFLSTGNLVFVGIRYKHLGYKTSEASPFYTTVLMLTVSELCILQQALSARACFRFPTAKNIRLVSMRIARL